MKAPDEIPPRAKIQNPYGVETIFKGPTSDIRDLTVLKGRDDTGVPYISSYWLLNESEKEYLKSLLECGNDLIIELTILGEGMPPVAVNLI